MYIPVTGSTKEKGDCLKTTDFISESYTYFLIRTPKSKRNYLIGFIEHIIPCDCLGEFYNTKVKIDSSPGATYAANIDELKKYGLQYYYLEEAEEISGITEKIIKTLKS